MNLYLKAYLTGSVLGILSEFLISRGKHHCIVTPSPKCLLSGTILNLYGWGALILTILLKYFRPTGLSVIPFVFSVVLIVTVLECAGGRLSYIHQKRKTWSYPPEYLPGCDGYVSVVASTYFAFLILIYMYVIYPIIK